MLDFLFWLVLVILIAASIEDLCKREVDHWIDLILIFGSFGFIFFKATFNYDLSIVILAGFSFGVMFILSHLIYYSRIFAAGDAKLLFSMFGFFIGVSAIETLRNIGLFVALLLICGSLWGFTYSLVLFFKNYKKAFKEFKKQLDKFYFILILAILISFIGLFVNLLILILPALLIFSALLFAFAKSVENVVMIQKKTPSQLTEGDWLAKDIKIGKKILKPNWEGLCKEDIELLIKYNKSINIKDGAPFVPGFLIAFLIFVFFI